MTIRPGFKRILIIADIEGSSRCWNYRASSFMTGEWAAACVGMSRDIDAVAAALFDAGAEEVTVKDFHRTGYNLLPELIDSRATLISGYSRGPVPGIGHPGRAEALMLVGMHAASGTDGFLAHTFTSRISRLTVNGRPAPEVAFFSASLAPFGISPVFFSGCPVACQQAEAVIPGIRTWAIDKSAGPEKFDAAAWRKGLARAAATSLSNRSPRPYLPQGPFRAEVDMRNGAAAAGRLARRWGLERSGPRLFLTAPDMASLYMAFIRLCYLTPAVERILPLGLFLFGLRGRFGIEWVRRRVKKTGVLPSRWNSSVPGNTPVGG